MKEVNVVADKSFRFAVRVVNLYKFYVRNGKNLFCQNSYFEVGRR